MKKLSIFLSLLFVSLIGKSQQSTIIEPKVLTIPVYANQSDVTSNILIPSKGMIVYSQLDSGFVFYNGAEWTEFTSNWTLLGSEIFNNNSGNVRIGPQTNSDSKFSVGGLTPKVAVGHVGSFNNANSGELLFEEDLNYGPGCGIKFQHNGWANSLYLLGGCSDPDTIGRFNRNGNSNLRRLRVGFNYNSNPLTTLSVDGNSDFTGNMQITGNLEVTGNITKGGGTFKIDHPLEPDSKYLVHSFVESPEMLNIYSGNTVTGENGISTIRLPPYFEAANKDFRYQLTVIGTFAQAIIKKKLNNNEFIIQTNEPGIEVSWTVMGIRADKYAEANRVIPVMDKEIKGTYLHPELYDAKPSDSITFRKSELKQVVTSNRSKDSDEN